MLNRAALIVRYRQPFIDWINAVDSSPDLPIEEVNQENNVYLLEIEDEGELQDWLQLNYDILFEEELYGWYTDPALWPQDRSLALFQSWCDVELHTVVLDTGESPLEDDED